MLSTKEKNKIRDVWLKAFEDLKRHGVPYKFTPRQLAGMYAVASICYDEGNHSPMIPDSLFDRLCKWLYRHFDECVKSGVDMLDRDLLCCCSGVDTKIFVKPYHDIAEMLLGHACGCIICKSQKDDEPRVGSINIPIPPPTLDLEPTLFDNIQS